MVKELTKTQRIIALITVIALLIYAIVNAFLVIFAYTKLNNNVQQLGDLANNWNKNSIQNITVAEKCPPGYESAFYDRQWPGVLDGCWCGDVSPALLDNYNISCSPFCTGFCNSDQRSVGCENVVGNDSKPLSYWGSINNINQQICVQRSSETWGEMGPMVQEDGSCPEDYSKCGTTPENVFCTKDAECPISEITIVSGTSNCGLSGNCVVLDNDGNDRIITWRRSDESDTLPLSEFRVNEYGMCDLVKRDDVTPGRKPFYLMAKTVTTCNNEGGSRWEISDTITEDILFDLNGLTRYIDSLENYPSFGMANGYYETGKSGANYQWRLFNRPYIPWNMKCRDQQASVLEKAVAVNKLKTAQLSLLVIGLVSTLVCGIILSWMEIQNLRGVDLTCIKGKGEEERQRLKKIKMVLNYCFKAMVVPFQIWAIILTSATKDLFTDVSERGCSNVETNEVLDYFAKTLSSTYQSNIISIAITIASLIFDIIMMMWENKKAKNEAQNGGSKSTKYTQNNPNQESNRNHQNNNNGKAPGESLGNPFANQSLDHSQNAFLPSPHTQPGGQTITIQLNQQPQNMPQNVPPYQYGQPPQQLIQPHPVPMQYQPQNGFQQPYGQPINPYPQQQPVMMGQPQMQFQGPPQNYPQGGQFNQGQFPGRM